MAFTMGGRVLAILFTLVLLFGFSYSVSLTSSPARIVNGLFSNAFSVVLKRVLSLKVASKTGRSMMKYESGYKVETVFDGSKLGIEPYAVEALPDGDLLILDSSNSNLYEISSSLSLYSRPKLVSGSAAGYYGHVDGKFKEARMNHPRGLTIDDRGNVYVADTENMAIRKISETGVTTIAGGKRGRGGGHVDGPSEDAKFSNDFDVIYVGSSCSLLVVDRGNKAIREIQLLFDDCAYQYGGGFPLGIATLIAAGFFGYMMALLQQRIGSIVSSPDAIMKPNASYNTNQKPGLKRPPLIPTGDEQEKQDENFLGSFGRLMAQTRAIAAETLGTVFPFLQKKAVIQESEQQYQLEAKYSNPWAAQESFVIPDEDEPPTIDTRAPTTRKTYAFMSKDPEKMHQLRQGHHVLYNGWDGDQKQHKTKKQQYRLSGPQTRYEQSSEKTGEIVFGAVQEQDRRRVSSMVVKPLNYRIPPYDDHLGFHSRISYARDH